MNSPSIDVVSSVAIARQQLATHSMAKTHIKHVDGMRAIAVLSVIMYHLHPQWLPGGFTGVDIFFVISGFVVTASLAQHGSESIFAFIGAFYHRRLTRILPALLAVLIVTALIYSILIPRSWLSGLTEQVAFLAFFGLSNFALQSQADAYFAPRAEFNPFTHTWSLGVEEQFYLLAPWLIYLHVAASRRFAATKRHPWEIVLIALASLVAMILWTKSAPLQAFYSIGSRFCELAAGCLWYLYLWSNRSSPALTKFSTHLSILGITAIVATFLFTRLDLFPFPWAIIAVAGTVLLIGVPNRDSLIRKSLASTVPVWIGLRSYSLYLWHWPVFVLLRWTTGLESAWTWPFALGATGILAEISYRWIESPLRRNPRWLNMPSMRAITISVAISVGCAYVAKSMLTNLNTLGISTVTRHRTDWYADHDDPTLSDREFPCKSQLAYRESPGMLVIEYRRVYCSDGTPPTTPETRNIFVLGDSHATAYIPLLHRLSVATGMNVFVYQIPGCPFVDLHAPMDTGRPAECVMQSRREVADVLALAKPGDAVFLPSLRLTRFVDHWGRMDESEVMRVQLGPDSNKLRELAIPDAHVWLQPLIDRKLNIIFEAPTPIFKSPPFRCVDKWTAVNEICGKGITETRAFEEWYRAPVVSAMRRLSANIENSSIYDPLPELCDAETCSARTKTGRPLFFDADHLSRFGNEVLYPSFHRHLIAIGTLRPH